MTYKKSNLQRIQLGIISFIWVLLFSTPLFFTNQEMGINWNMIRKIWTEYAGLFILFIINRFVLVPQLFFKGKRLSYFLVAGGFILLFFLGMYQIHLVQQTGGIPDFIHHKPGPPPGPHQPAIPAFANLFILSFLILGFDTGLNISIRWIVSEQEKVQLEKEHTDNQLAFLKSQVSPHFFMNTLNNIHALVDIDQTLAKDSIIRLSRLMSYLLYESQAKKVPLEKEMDFIRSYVELMQLRFTDKVQIQLHTPEQLPPLELPPLLFISFVENAFKHGISYKKKSSIVVQIDVHDKRLLVVISNTNHAKNDKDEHSGLGIENSKKRLQLLFGNEHELLIDDKEDLFTVQLNIPL